MRRLLIAALILPVLALVACGGDSEDDEIESVLRTYVGHYVDSEFEQMYAMFDSTSQQKCGQDAFVIIMAAARSALGEREFVIEDIFGVVVENGAASASVRVSVGGEIDTTENTLVKEDGEWKLELPFQGC